MTSRREADHGSPVSSLGMSPLPGAGGETPGADLLQTPQAGAYACLLADPPWQFRAGGKDRAGSRAVEKHYSTMSQADLSALPVRQAAGRDCHLFLWVTSPMIPQALVVMRAWGFRYSTVAFSWAKLKPAHDHRQMRLTPLVEGDFWVGLGLTTRKNAEFVLLGRRGSPKRQAKDVRELIIAPVREHSRKPDEVFARIERYCTGPRLELFARQRRPGWDAWGHEADRF
jgi:N6-adenosine-specific RNA methylase IME4